MTTMSKSWLGASAFCAMLAVVGCSNGNSNTAPAQQYGRPGAQQQYGQPGAQQQYGQPGAQQQYGQPAAGQPKEPEGMTSRHATAPVILNLRGPANAMGGSITLDLEIVVNEPVNAPTTLQVLLPPGVSLVSGLPNEVLSLPQPGKLYRQYVVQSPGPLNQPVYVTAQAQGPNNAWGFSAKRQYPPADNSLPPYPRRGPAGRPPVMPIR